MNLSTQSLNLYSKLLNISKQNAQQIRNLCEKQTNAVWRSLLKVQYSLQISNHNQAANELKISKSQIMSFMNYNNSKENEKIYQKVFVCVLANLINRLIMATKYGEALECFEQLNNALKDKTILKQALHNLFGFTSLVSLDSYNIQNNSEFKYSPETQAKFFYIVGKIKKLTYKTQEAKVLFEKILKIKETCDLNILIVSKVYYYLAQIDQVKYNSEFSKIKKSYQSLCEHVHNQDKVSQQMIKTLLNKQTLLNKENRSLLQSQKMEPKINKVMLKMYLQKLSRDQKNISFETQKYLKQLFQALKQDSNHSTLQQIMKSPEAKEAGVYFNQNINKIFKIVPKYYGRKLLDKIAVNRKINSPTNSSIIQSNSPYKSAISKTQIKRDRSIPEDKIRAEKILKKCCDGSYLIKINFGSKSYVKKFVRIQQKGLKWADNQIQMQSTSSACKWKHVLGIVYGKVSENFTKTKFKAFESHRCFSLITKERSYDFYCDNESDIYFWLQGISYKLQLFHNNSKTYPFYSKARAIWKMMLLKMGTKYYDAKKKYKCGNAGAVLGFKKYLMIQK